MIKTNNVSEHEDTDKYRQLLVRTLHSCSVRFPDMAANVIPVVCNSDCLPFEILKKNLKNSSYSVVKCWESQWSGIIKSHGQKGSLCSLLNSEE